MSESENRRIETRLPIARVNKAGLVRKRRPKGEPTVFMGIRVNSVNKARFIQTCHHLNLLVGEVIDNFMADSWQKYTGEKGNVQEEYESLQHEADRLYDSLPGIRRPIVHWELFKKQFVTLGGDIEQWKERNARSTLFAIYRKLGTTLQVGSKCPDCSGVVQTGHFDADYRKFDMYIMAKVRYAEVDRKLKQVTEIIIQQEGFAGNPATEEADKAEPEPAERTATTNIISAQEEGLAKGSTTEGEHGEPETERVEEHSTMPQHTIGAPRDDPRVAPRRIVTITGRELAETIQPARVSARESKENETKAD